MTLQLLVAAMNKNALELAEEMQIGSDAIIISQGEAYSYEETEYKGNKLRYFSMAERGVGLSRNTALLRADADIILFADEDIVYREGYAEAVQCHVDYLFGKNITKYSYVTGFGTKPYMNPHSRPLQVDGIEEPVPGLVSGGPNGHPWDPAARELLAPGTAPMKCFVDVWESYSTNEITIYWNSSAIYNTAFLRR